jgi:hypothetical protein
VLVLYMQWTYKGSSMRDSAPENELGPVVHEACIHHDPVRSAAKLFELTQVQRALCVSQQVSHDVI